MPVGSCPDVTSAAGNVQAWKGRHWPGPGRPSEAEAEDNDLFTPKGHATEHLIEGPFS